MSSLQSHLLCARTFFGARSRFPWLVSAFPHCGATLHCADAFTASHPIPCQTGPAVCADARNSKLSQLQQRKRRVLCEHIPNPGKCQYLTGSLMIPYWRGRTFFITHGPCTSPVR